MIQSKKLSVEVFNGKIMFVGESSWVDFTSRLYDELNQCFMWAMVTDVLGEYFLKDGSYEDMCKFLEVETQKDVNKLIVLLSDEKFVGRFVTRFVEFIER